MIEKTKETLLKFMGGEHYHMTPQDVAKKLAACKCVMPFQADQWDKYIYCLTGQTPCVYCGAPKYMSRELHNYVCMERKTHFYMLKTELFYIHANRCTPEEAREFFMRVCEHGELTFCCDICIQATIKKNAEEADRLAAEF